VKLFVSTVSLGSVSRAGSPAAFQSGMLNWSVRRPVPLVKSAPGHKVASGMLMHAPGESGFVARFSEHVPRLMPAPSVL
jgi:hypothetical protein